jgi:hypothetical protein
MLERKANQKKSGFVVVRKQGEVSQLRSDVVGMRG